MCLLICCVAEMCYSFEIPKCQKNYKFTLMETGSSSSASSSSSTMNVDSDGSAVVETKTLRSFVMSAEQVYERFEKLPLEQRKITGSWALSCANSQNCLLVMPKAGHSQGRPERWKIFSVDTQRWNAFSWRRIVWIAVNAMVFALSFFFFFCFFFRFSGV
jgi:hypothetical protein